MGILSKILKAIFGGQTSVQVGKSNQSAQSGDNSPITQTSVGDVRGGNVTIDNSQGSQTEGGQEQDKAE